MPRRGEESSPAPRRSPRAAVKASASPSPIIRVSRSQSSSSAAKQSTPKTRAVSPSPKGKAAAAAAAKGAKSKVKEETPKASQRSPRTPANKQISGDTKKTPASGDRGSRTTARQSSAKSAAKGKGRQSKEAEEEAESSSEEETTTAATTTTTKSRSRSKSQSEVKETPTRGKAGRGQAVAAEKKGQSAATRKGKSPSAKEAVPKEEEASAEDDQEKGKNQNKKQASADNEARVESRSRRSTGRKSEDTVTEEVTKGRTARSRSRGQGKKATEDEDADSVTEEPKGRTSRARSRGQSRKGSDDEDVSKSVEEEKETDNKASSDATEESESKVVTDVEPKSDVKGELETKGSSDDSVVEDVTEESDKSSSDSKSRKRGAVEIEKSPESVSPGSKRKRMSKGASEPTLEKESIEVVPVPEEKAGAAVEASKSSSADEKPKLAESEKKQTQATETISPFTESKTTERITTDMEVDVVDSPTKVSRTPSPKKTPTKQQQPLVAVSSPKKTEPVAAVQSTAASTPTVKEAAMVTTTTTTPSTGVIDLSKSPLKHQTEVCISKEPPAAAGLHSPESVKQQKSESPSKIPSKSPVNLTKTSEPVKTVSKSESIVIESASKSSPMSASVSKTEGTPVQSALTKSNSETVSAKLSKDVPVSLPPLKSSPLKSESVVTSSKPPITGELKPHTQPSDKTAKPSITQPLSMVSAKTPVIQAPNAKTTIAMEKTPPTTTTTTANVTSPSSKPSAVPSAGSLPAKSPVKTELKSHSPSIMAYPPKHFTEAGPVGSPVRSHNVTMHGSPVKLPNPVTSTFSPAKLPDHTPIPQRPPESSSLVKSPSTTGVDLSSKQPGHSSSVAPKITSYASSQSLPAKSPSPALLSTASVKTSNVESFSGKPSTTPIGSIRPAESLPVVSSIKTPPQSTPPKDKPPVTGRMITGDVSGTLRGASHINPSHTHDLSLKPPHAGSTSYPISTSHTVFSKSASPAHAPPTTAALPQRIPLCKPTPDFSVGKPPIATTSPTKITLKPNSPISEVKHSVSSPSMFSKISSQQSDPHCSKPLTGPQMSLKPVPRAAEISTAPSHATTHVDTKAVSSAAAEHKQSKPYYLDKPHVTASSMKPILPPDAASPNPIYYSSSSSKPPLSTSEMSASKSFSPTFPSNPILMSAMPKTPSSPADSAAMSRHMGTMPAKPVAQEAHQPSGGFPKRPGSPPLSIAASKPPMAHSAKPQITHMTGVVTAKAAVAHSTSISSSKPQITRMTGTVPPKVSSPSPALSKPPVTHMAGIALQKPQVTHMAGVAPPKPLIQPSESGLSSKPVVLHAMGSASKPVSSHPSSQSPMPTSPNKMETAPQGGNTSADTDRTKSLHEKSQSLPVSGMDSSKYMSPSKSSDPGCGRSPVDMTQKPYGGHYMPKSDGSNPYMSRPQASPVSYAKAFNLEQKCEQLQHPQKSVVQTVRVSEPQEVNLSANKPKPLLPTPGNTDQFRKETIDLKTSPLKSAANSQDCFKVKSMVPAASAVVGNKPLSGPHDKVPSPTVASKTGVPITGCGVLNVTTSSHDSKMMSSKPQHNTGSSVNTPAQHNKPAYLAPSHPVTTFGPVSTPSFVTSSGSSKAASVDVINGTKTSTESQQVCDLSKKRKADSSEEDTQSSKKARSAEEEANLVANGQKTSGSSQPASRVVGETKVNKTEPMEVSQSSTQSSSNVDALRTDCVVNKDDVPPKDSVEVRQSLPKSPCNPKPLLKHPLPTSQSTAPQLPKHPASSGLSCGPSGSSFNRDTLLSRSFRFNPTLPSNTIMDKSRQFSVVSYNILADCHFHKVIKDRYPAEEKHFLELPVRHKRLMSELSYIDADVVCLQEVEPEYYSKTLSPDMQKLGYEGFYKKRVHENYDEGETTFYKTSRFSDAENTAYSLKQLIDKDIQEMSLSEEVKESVRRFMCLPDVLLVTRLRCKNTGKFITVGNVHINWGHFKLPNIQCVQIARAIKEVVNRAGNDFNPHVICGDFNSSPNSPGYQLASEGYLADAMIQLLQSSKTMEMPDGSKSALVDHLWEGFQHTSSSLKSAYAVVQGTEPAMTTMTKNTHECLDYVFYSSTSLEAVGVLQVPGKQNVLDCKFIPNRIFPSDHLSLKAVLAFK